MYKDALAFSNLQWLIFHKPQRNQSIFYWFLFFEINCLSSISNFVNLIELWKDLCREYRCVSKINRERSKGCNRGVHEQMLRWTRHVPKIHRKSQTGVVVECNPRDRKISWTKLSSNSSQYGKVGWDPKQNERTLWPAMWKMLDNLGHKGNKGYTDTRFNIRIMKFSLLKIYFLCLEGGLIEWEFLSMNLVNLLHRAEDFLIKKCFLWERVTLTEIL